MKLTTLFKTGVLSLATIIAFSSCGEDKKTAQKKAASAPISLDVFILKEEPMNAIDIADMRKSATPGEPVTFVGKVIGGVDVFMGGRAVMTVGDSKKITSCDLIPGDSCETPWDVCCDDPDVIKASIVTVQIVDDKGKPLKTGLKGFNGLKELSEVVVTGNVAKGSNKDNMVINATGIFVKK